MESLSDIRAVFTISISEGGIGSVFLIRAWVAGVNAFSSPLLNLAQMSDQGNSALTVSCSLTLPVDTSTSEKEAMICTSAVLVNLVYSQEISVVISCFFFFPFSSPPFV